MTHVVSLRVTDSADVESSADTVTITVIPGFKAPVADAGPDQDNIVPGATVSLAAGQWWTDAEPSSPGHGPVRQRP